MGCYDIMESRWDFTMSWKESRIWIGNVEKAGFPSKRERLGVRIQDEEDVVYVQWVTR